MLIKYILFIVCYIYKMLSTKFDKYSYFQTKFKRKNISLKLMFI